MAENEAATITAPTAHPFTIENVPKPQPGPGQLVIRNAAVAINPADWKVQTFGGYPNKYPFILGHDAAGIVEEVGPNVTRFKKGQRVIAHCSGFLTRDAANGGFQLYPMVNESLTAEIPESLPFEQAVVLPLVISTAASGLYPEDCLNLPLPVVDGVKKTGQTLLVWGGASSTGSTTIQLAVASGLTVVTTASPSNHDFVLSLGAQAVFDYRSPSVVEDIANALTNTEFVGVYDAISEEPSFKAISAILDRLETAVKVISVLPYDKPTEHFAPKFVMAFGLIQEPNREIGEWIWGTYVPQALEKGSLKPKPDPYVVGTGLKDIQHGVDVLKKGVSAQKVVVTL
ncbi:chaperonin 10-like protein [Aspergillus ambiguus]|uniref:zinc-binding alcohol dehydrogenase family protein n=1 Tax=Aspergillus ambiguus TaxID=176160 RepID=UPI003CCCE8F7